MKTDFTKQNYHWLVTTMVTASGPLQSEAAAEEIARRGKDGQIVCQACSGHGWFGFRRDNEMDELCGYCEGLGTLKGKRHA